LASLKFQPNQYILIIFSYFFCNIFGIHVDYTYKEKIDEKKLSPCLLMFSHGSNIDPSTIMSNPPLFFNWVGKKELFSIPWLGWLMLKSECILAIDRSNR